MQFSIILVSPARPENVGAAARAMKTMGFRELRLVDSGVHLSSAARAVAHGANEILEAASVWPTLEAALADVDFSVATTARSRAKFHYYATPQEVTSILSEKRRWAGRIGLVFGREDSGLTNEELALVDLLTGVPMIQEYPSLNLGQAVMVYCYQLSSLSQHPAGTDEASDRLQLAALRRRMHCLIGRLGVSDDIKLVDWLEQRIGYLQQRDTAMLHRLLHDIEKNLIDKNSGV
ncbi:tRNA/rRNA methyltransferase [Izhakiella capsodis]|uniref:tRNA (cytidine/uridine-2'-O-)-methyltransferase TrmJ n=1 Tax=Izhakiella capsodis TaxID=1367852 RepID=A0A1I4X0C6_9GAMM|nr:tRNA/rRNA methyltransferase [Izhakiella capsodis]SFN18830.1 tRNA/rRNA methyltransferase [Izhakiella capsodis]